MSHMNIDYPRLDKIDTKELHVWCEEISAVIRYFNFFEANKILCGVNTPLIFTQKIEVKSKGLSFFSQWKMLAPRTNFMYLSDKPYIDSKQNAYRLFFINLDPYIFKLNHFLNIKQNFFFFFFHEFAHCLDLAYNQKIITDNFQPIETHKSITQDHNVMFTESENNKNHYFNNSWNMEAFADIMAVKILYQFFPHLQIKHKKIIEFREFEATRVKSLHHAHNTSKYFQLPSIEAFLERHWGEDENAAQELKTLI